MNSLNRPIRVLFVLNDGDGGATLSAIQLAESFSLKDVQCFFVCHPRGARQRFEKLRQIGSGLALVFMPWCSIPWREAIWLRPAIWLKRMGQSGFRVWSTFRVWRKIGEWGIDIVHTNTILQVEGALAAKIRGVPHIWHIRELVGSENSFRFHLPMKWVTMGVTRLSSVVVANSEASASCLLRAGAVPNLKTLPNAIDVAAFSEGDAAERGRRLRAEWGESSDVVVGMCAAIGVRLKRHDLFIKAAISIAKKCPDARFVLYGRVPSSTESGFSYYSSLRQLIVDAGLGERFHFVGHIDDVPAAMNAIDLLVHPSPGESFGRVVIEAMAAGRPVIVANSGALSELVHDGENGFVVDPKDADLMGQKICELASSNNLRHRFGECGRQRAEANYSLERLSRDVGGIYQELLK